MSMANGQPHFLALQQVAAEVGVDPKTIVRHPDDFFPSLTMGTKRWVASAVYSRWLQRRLSEAAGKPEGSGT